MAAPIQQHYRRYQQPGWPGSLVRPTAPHEYENHKLYVPANATKPKPGDAVIWDRARNAVKLPATDAEVREVVGIIEYDSGTVQSTSATVPTGGNSDALVEYNDGAFIKIGVMGTFYVMAHAAMAYGDLVRWRTGNQRWERADTTYGFGAADISATAHLWADASVTTDRDGELARSAATLGSTNGTDAARDAWNDAFDAVITRLNDMRGDLLSWRRLPITCVSPDPVSAGEIAEIRVGFGRSF